MKKKKQKCSQRVFHRVLLGTNWLKISRNNTIQIVNHLAIMVRNKWIHEISTVVLFLLFQNDSI